MKNTPPTYQKTITKTFKKYLDDFMKIFLDDFIMYSGMENHMQKFILCFQNCKEYGISLNPNKFAFMVFSGVILGFITSKERKLPNPKKIQAILNMPPPKNPHYIQIFNRMAQLYKYFIKTFVAIMAHITKLTRKTKASLWTKDYHKVWELIKQKYIETSILISPNWEVEFHVHTYASLLIMGAMLS